MESGGRRYDVPASPTKTAQPSIYDPLAEYQNIVLDVINIGRMESQKKSDTEIQKAIQQFAVKWFVRFDDGSAYHTQLHGLRGGLSSEKSFYLGIR